MTAVSFPVRNGLPHSPPQKAMKTRSFETSILIISSLVAWISTVGAQQPAAPVAPALSSIDQRFYASLKEAASRTDLELTKKSGGHGGGAFAEVRPEGGILVGLELWQGDYFGHLVIRGVRAIYQTATGRVRGAGHGNIHGEPAARIEAKDGYAIAAIEPRGGDRLDGLQALIWKIHPTTSRLDAEGAYKSDWVGGHGGGKKRHPLSSDGRPVLGITVASGDQVDRLGLIYVEPK